MKIFCVGRNYTEHAKELQNEVPESPVIFMKPPTALVKNGAAIEIPFFTQDMHYEGELVLKIGKSGRNIQEQEALTYIDKVTVGIDFTARDLQSELKKKGLPWEISKGFDGSAIAGSFIPFKNQKQFQFLRNNTLVQDGNTDEMIFSFSKIIQFISSYFTLEKGDLIFTGTPKGVGKTISGDLFTGILEGRKVLTCYVK